MFDTTNFITHQNYVVPTIPDMFILYGAFTKSEFL
jgi:hypothetical protein